MSLQDTYAQLCVGDEEAQQVARDVAEENGWAMPLPFVVPRWLGIDLFRGSSNLQVFCNIKGQRWHRQSFTHTGRSRVSRSRARSSLYNKTQSDSWYWGRSR